MSDPNCPCDGFVHPEPLAIDAGLPALPRQIATFAEFRRAMMAALPTRPALAAWRARGDQDLGVMLIEMWAYVCDVVGFYDETIANESYLRTARLAPSVRKLVGLLGYRPRPPVAARARLAVKLDGRTPLVLPAGTAFRSAAFGSEPPQVFELDADTRVHPLLNGWSLAPVRPTTVAAGATALLLAPDSARVRAGDRLLIRSGEPVVATALSVATIVGSDNQRYRQVQLDTPLPAALPIAGTKLLRPTASVPLWSHPADTRWTLTVGGHSLYLAAAVPQIRAGADVIARGPSGSIRLNIRTAEQRPRRLAAGGGIDVGSNHQVTLPDIQIAVTYLTVDPGWPASMGTNAAQISIEYALEEAGTITAPLKPRIAPGDPLRLLPPIEAPPDGTRPGNFLIADADGTALELSGGVDFAARTLNPAQGSSLVPLDPPATVYANVVSVSRGETVPREALGVGDASIASQRFALKNKPLTYVAAPTSADLSGARSTLTVWVRDIQWHEVPTFFGAAATDQVYIVRQDDDGVSWITFGDGIRGARLPAGAAVVARYRFGAGAASPPVGGIGQIARPVKGLTTVRNPVAAAGGANREQATQLRVYAPRSTLLFGRAVSIKDMEALAARQPGVEAVQAQWTWDAAMQQPVVQLWYVGPASIAADVTASLRAAVAPSTPLKAAPAQAIAATLVIALRVDRRHQLAPVQAAVAERLLAPETGALAPAQIGIGVPLFRSRILAETVAVDGVRRVDGLLWRGAPLDAYGVSPGDGAWFQVSLTVAATEDQDG